MNDLALACQVKDKRPLPSQELCLSFKIIDSVYILVLSARYYVAHASKPKDRVALALAVNVGSLVEEEEERGVAHILEHLAFNATEASQFIQTPHSSQA